MHADGTQNVVPQFLHCLEEAAPQMKIFTFQCIKLTKMKIVFPAIFDTNKNFTTHIVKIGERQVTKKMCGNNNNNNNNLICIAPVYAKKTSVARR